MNLHVFQRFFSNESYRGELIGKGQLEGFRAKGRAPSLLALHGFGSTPGEVLLLTDLANERGLAHVAPLLPGHGTRASDLARTDYGDWYDAAEDELLELSEAGPVIVGGQSMGAVLALDLAAQQPTRICAAIVLATATRLQGPYPSLALAAAVRAGVPDFLMPKFSGPDISLPELKLNHLTYDAQPIYAAEELRRAGARVRARLGAVHCPTFIAHGLHDHVCPVANAWDVADRLGTSDVEVVLLPRSCHILTKDQDRARLRTRVSAFLDRVLTAQRPVEP